MKLVSFGDSFVEGLIKDPEENSLENRDLICFTRKISLASNFFDSYTNYGTRGIGNVAIAYQIYKHLKNNDSKNQFLLITWSGLERYSVYNRKTDQYDISSFKRLPFEPIFQINMLSSGIHNLLKSKGIPHMFTSSFTPFYLFHDKCAIPSNYIIGDVDKSNSLFDIISNRFNTKAEHFGDYLTSHASFNVKKSKLIARCLHPTDKGHTHICNTLLPYIENYLNNFVDK